MIKNIYLISLNQDFSKSLAKTLSKKMGMFYANIDELLEFDILDIKEATKKTGKNYIAELVTKKIKQVCGFENTFISSNYSYLLNEKNLNLIKEQCLIIFIKISKTAYKKTISNLREQKKQLELSVFNERNKMCKKISNIIISLKNVDEEKFSQEVMNAIKEYFKS